ncbi:hypothetical protein A2U01_0091278, partial [Trifolium medium]|nr:hypothetical protein [Trifolium medium]
MVEPAPSSSRIEWQRWQCRHMYKDCMERPLFQVVELPPSPSS